MFSKSPGKNLPLPLDAVIFDMDGLLLDTEALHRRTMSVACAELGYRMTDGLFLSMVGSPEEAGDAKLRDHFGPVFPLADFHAANQALLERLSAEGIPLRPGASGIVSFLKARGIPQAVATSSDRGMALEYLRRAGLLDSLAAVVTRTDVTCGKPHPETYLKAAMALEARPEHCLALEDSHNGVRSAAAAGMATVMVPDSLSPTPEMHGLCIGVADSLVDMREELEKLFSHIA